MQIYPTNKNNLSPVNARALNTEQNAQVDAGPAWVGLAAVTTDFISWQRLYPV